MTSMMMKLMLMMMIIQNNKKTVLERMKKHRLPMGPSNLKRVHSRRSPMRKVSILRTFT